MPDTYPKRFNAQRGARRALKDQKAREGIDFTTAANSSGKWTFTLIASQRNPPAPAKEPRRRKPTPPTKKMVKEAADRAEATSAARAKKNARTVKSEASSPTRMNGKYRVMAEAAARGDLPTAPDLSAETHQGYRGALRKVVAMVERRDLDGLMNHKMKPTCSGPKMIIRYRDLAIHALKVRRAEGRLESPVPQIDWERGLLARATDYLAIRNGGHDNHLERAFLHLDLAASGAIEMGPRTKVFAVLENTKRLMVGRVRSGKFIPTEAAASMLTPSAGT